MRKNKEPKTEDCVGGEELISELPDDILIHVLSLLAPEEVIRCGALSHRWTTLPKLVPMALKFAKMCNFMSLIEETKFIHHVNQVLDSYPAEILTELSISFEWSARDHQPRDIRSQFDKCVQFAMAKKVGKFNLDLGEPLLWVPGPKYRFPPILYDKKILRSRDSDLSWCTSLTDLRLNNVNVCGKHIERFLECCPFLESLYVGGSDSLTSLKVDGPIRLKFLEIQLCDNLRCFEISAPNLISFKYEKDPMKSMPLKCTPQLNELSISGYYFLVDNLHLFTSYFAQIETLSLIVRPSKSRDLQWLTGIPTLRNLKHLTIYDALIFNECQLCFVSWIEACPILRRFVFKQMRSRCKMRRKAVKPKMCPHQFLKEVKFSGFIEDILETELVIYIIENAVNLHKIIFGCSRWQNDGSRSRALARAREFQSMLSPAVECVLI